MALMVTISGVRGIVGETLLPNVVEKFVGAFSDRVKKWSGVDSPEVIVGCDSRVSGPWVMRIVEATLAATGCSCLNVGIVPTPTVQVMVQQKSAQGGIVVTSSHNPVMWNGLKFVDSDGLFLSPARCEEMFSVADSGSFFSSYCSWDKLGSIHYYNRAIEDHISLISALPYVPLGKIRARSFKVCLDAVNGAGGPILLSLLRDTFGCTVIPLNCDTSGIFQHMPEPIPEHLQDLCSCVRENHADFGIAVDPDVDRCVLVDEYGHPIGEEYTLALAVQFLLGIVGKRGTVVKNLSSSRASDEIARHFGCEVVSSRVGEIEVAKKMVSHNAVIGGEGNGGVMLPDIHIGRDAPVAVALTLAHLVEVGGSLSALKSSLPQFEIVKMKAPRGKVSSESIVARFRKEWEGKSRLNTEDGLKIDTDDWWVHLRKSNTEPIIRIIAEARTRVEAMSICLMFKKEIEDMTK